MIILRQKEFIWGGQFAIKTRDNATDKMIASGNTIMNLRNTTPEDKKLAHKMLKIARDKYNLGKVTGDVPSQATVPTIVGKATKFIHKHAPIMVEKDMVSNAINSKFQTAPTIGKKISLGDKIYDNSINGKGSLILHSGINNNRPEVIAHELGHERNCKYGFGFPRAMTAGLLDDINSNNEKKTIGQAIKSNLLTVAGGIPQLAEEGLASLKGLRIMKKAGATSEQMKTGKQNLKTAFNTYTNNFKRNLAEPWANIQERQDRYNQIMQERKNRKP